jgi:hypothetical protein
MPELDFHVESAAAVPYSAAPQLAMKLRVAQQMDGPAAPVKIQSVALHCQIRLEPGRRRYSPSEQEKLVELYGEPHRWGQTVRSTLWANVDAAVPSFVDSAVVDLIVPCTYDFNIAMMKYFYALEEGHVPLCLLFSGTIFYTGEEGELQIEQISWEKETYFRLPVNVWKQMMQIYYPNSAWLCLHQDVFDKLYQFKIQRGLATWEQALESLLASAAQEEVME